MTSDRILSNVCCIVVPVYKESITINEKASLKQALALLPHYSFCIVCPEGLNISGYIDIIRDFNEIDYQVKEFKQFYFTSIDGYNQLLLSLHFYKRFITFDFILIYQLDAWVFKNELEYWCEQGYDYIGAPWFEGLHLASNSSTFAGVGNGGFSLRKTSSHIRVLSSFKYIKPFSELWKSYRDRITFRSTIKLFLNLSLRNNFFYLINNFDFQEDIFWGKLTPARFDWYKVPSEEVALKFSMEVNSPLLYKMNDNCLPFGCHAWEKYHYDFWKEFIEISDKKSIL